VRRILAILVLVMLPLQFSWGAVAVYCEHETQGAGHFGHHEHQHNAVTETDPHADPASDTGATGDKAPGAVDLDCGHCHGQCSITLALPAEPPGALSTAPPGASASEAGGAHAPARPERPQWLRLA
jgi:hypothetical protein